MVDIICIGAAHIDIKARLLGSQLITDDSNPVRTERTFGGVARNVANGLARLGNRPALVSRIGADSTGQALLSLLDASGVDVRGVVVTEDWLTASYTAILTDAGQLAAGLMDDGIYQDFLTAMMPSMAGLSDAKARVWFVDANLPEPAINWLAAMVPDHVFLAADCVSTAKAARLEPLLGRLDLLIANQIEAAVLCPTLPFDADPGTLAQAVQALGPRYVVTPMGARGCLVASATGVLHWPAITDTVVQDVTGASDALTVGLLHGVLAHDDASRAIHAAMPFAIACATFALESTISGLASVDVDEIHSSASALANPVVWQGVMQPKGEAP